jgi:aminodeoxyfutalosine synthase
MQLLLRLFVFSFTLSKFFMTDQILRLISDMEDVQLVNIAEKVENEKRINEEDALYLLKHASVSYCGLLANYVREKKHGDNTYFNRNFHIEPTNVCVFSCQFCSYSRLYAHRDEGWEMSLVQMLDIVKKYDSQPVTEVHIVGGVHPKMNLSFFEELLREIKKHRPELHIKGFTAVELDYMFRKAKVTVAEGLKRLQAAGLDSLPGGGAEIFSPEIRNQIAGDKIDGNGWLFIHKTAHELGLHSNATMLYGHIEKPEHLVDHMSKLRDLQDETGGFNTFIPLKFRNQNNDMSHVAESTLIHDMKVYAVARLFLDNFPHLKAYWPMLGRQHAQMTLSFGVNDLDGTIDDTTKIYSMAGSEEQNPSMTTEELTSLIMQAGRVPVERDTLYQVIKTYHKESLNA